MSWLMGIALLGPILVFACLLALEWRHRRLRRRALQPPRGHG
ncbi:hypothetical protein [Nitrospira sp. Kam-Ns4a]